MTRSLLVLLALLFASPVVAQSAINAATNTSTNDAINADRPGIADSSVVVGRGTFQVETGVERDHQRSDGVDQQSLSTPTLLRYGLTSALELRLEGAGYQKVRTCDSASCDTSTGWAPVSIGAKYHFRDHSSLGVIARAFVIHSDHATGDVRLAADLDLTEKWSLNPNLGAAREDDHGRLVTKALEALTLQYNLTSAANVFVDGGLDGSNLLLDAGGAWVIGKDTQLDLSVGWGAHGNAVPNVFWSAGISRRF